MSAKIASNPTQTAPTRKTPSRLTASKSSHSKSAASSLTHEALAVDIAAFKKAGGHIEVLGHTPFRTAAPSRSSTKAPTPVAAAPAARKST